MDFYLAIHQFSDLLRYTCVSCMYLFAMNGMVVVFSLRVELSLPTCKFHHGATVTSKSSKAEHWV